MARAGDGAAWGSLLAGVASIATIPLAILLTRYSGSYELLHAGFTIPIAAALGLTALALARRARLRASLTLAGGRLGAARMGQVLGFVGLCMAAAAVVSLVVYGLLEYVGSRD